MPLILMNKPSHHSLPQPTTNERLDTPMKNPLSLDNQYPTRPTQRTQEDMSETSRKSTLIDDDLYSVEDSYSELLGRIRKQTKESRESIKTSLKKLFAAYGKDPSERTQYHLRAAGNQ